MVETNAAGDIVAGQVWTYKTRSGEENSRLTILRTESHPQFGGIVNISIDGLQLKNPKVPGGVISTVGHMPYQEAALRSSLVSVVGTTTTSASLDGYKDWKEAFDQGKAGVWTLPVAEAVAAMETVMNQ